MVCLSRSSKGSGQVHSHCGAPFALRWLPWLQSDGLSEQAHCGGGCGLSEQVEPGLPEQVEQGQQAGALALRRLRSV